MRLWHYKLIPFLPDSQLIAQWRELNSIFKKQDKHILINYVYEYEKGELYYYTQLIIKELKKRNVKVRSYENMNNYYKDYSILDFHEYDPCYQIMLPFQNHHNERYMLQCFYNLQEKYDRGQKDFSEEQYKKLEEFVKKEVLL